MFIVPADAPKGFGLIADPGTKTYLFTTPTFQRVPVRFAVIQSIDFVLSGPGTVKVLTIEHQTDNVGMMALNSHRQNISPGRRQPL